MRTNFNMQDQYITMVRGDTLSFGVEIKDQDGEYLDVETAYFTCKKNLNDDDPVFQKEMDTGITRDDTGRYVVRVAPSDTADIEAGRYYYDLQVGLNGDIFTLLRGVLDIQMDVTVNGGAS